LTFTRALAVVDAHSQANTNAPADGSPWLNIGTVWGAGCIYLGDRWCLTAYHVNAGDTKFSGVTWKYDGISYRLTNSDGTGTDLALFHIAGSPPLTNLSLTASSPLFNSTVKLIGYGRIAGSAQTAYNPTNTGFNWSGDLQTRSWGNNAVSSSAVETVESYGFGNLLAFETTFDQTGGTSDECEAAVQDSGGGVFQKWGSTWYLVGVINAISVNAGQPGGTACYNDKTYYADISSYRAQILSLMASGAPPYLDISKTSGNIHLYWPGAAAGYRLMSSTNLVSTNWTALTASLTAGGATNYPATNAARFFRLQKP
jgi:hypothetical protein